MSWSCRLCQFILEWKVSNRLNDIIDLFFFRLWEIEHLYRANLTEPNDFCFYQMKIRKNGEEMRDEKRTLECLKKAARIASQCMDTGVQVQICVELLNHYLFYFERGNSLISVDLLNQVS